MAVSPADVRALYLNFLGRLPSDSEISSRVSNQANTVDGMKTELLGSAEAADRSNLIRNAYRHWLGREATEEEVNAKLQENTTQNSQMVISGIKNSTEGAGYRAALSAYIDAYIPYDPGFSGLKNAVNGKDFHHQETAGMYHWMTSGKNENRILPIPGGTPRLYINENGEIELLDKKWFSGPAYRAYENIVKSFQEAEGGNYLQLIENAKNNLRDGYSNADFEALTRPQVDAYYTKNIIAPWRADIEGANPPVRGFDPTYYLTQSGAYGQEANSQFDAAIQQRDLDIIGRFSRDTYAHYHYTTVGKDAGARANEAETAELVRDRTEYLTDADYQLYRDQVLGLGADEKSDTILEGQLSSVLGEKERESQKMFGALTIDSLRQSLQELREAKKQEQEYDFYKGMPQVNEVLSINESIANSLLGDTGIGGIMGWMGDTEEMQESFESQLEKATGIPSKNNAVYNWQKWFDEQLVTRYAEGATFTDPDDPTKTYTIDAAFAKDYIDRYLKPRFDTSRSMSEFISYMDVQQKEQNIFQTQSALDSLRSLADIRARAYLDQIYRASNPTLGGTASTFDPDFYWNPVGNFSTDDPKAQKYIEQQQRVAADYAAATTAGDSTLVPGTDLTWSQWAYNYGLDLNDKQQFAQLHYQVFGAAQGYDPIKDVLTYKDAEDYIKTNILPVIADEKVNLGNTTFLNFVTPEEFADSMLEGISPAENKEEWDKLLETLGLSTKDMGIDEVKQYIIEAFQTEAAKTIREGIKYLNEKKKAPTQKELGVEYIQRPEDAQPTTSAGETKLYSIFKNAGYEGNEDEFYEKFMPDVDRGEMELITQGQKGLELTGEYKGLTSDDPFESVFSMEKLFEEQAETNEEEGEEETPSYFRLFDEDEKDDDYKSDTGKKILGEFTSMFKGFS